MSLRVRVSRPSAEPWGFRLIGGSEYTMPLTIVKVQPGSPADASGLLHGDTLMSINRFEAASMRHEEAFAAIKDCKEVLELEVVRGHYDMVLEEEYQDIPQEDSDLPSEATEVLPPEPPSLDADIIPVPELELLKPEPLNPDDSRSQTASPFLLPTKPYRPFSTEPIPEIPDLESPIILNPHYHDEFGMLKEVEEFLPKTKFKLPVSEQYNPEYGNENKVKETKEDKRSFASEVVQTSLTEYKSVEEKVTREEIRFMEQMKKDIDLDRIEETASFADQTIQQTAINVVEESIIKAVTVSEEIKREIDIELHSEEIKSTVVVADEIKKLNEVELLNAESRQEETAAKVNSEVKEVESTVKMTTNVAKEISVIKQDKKESKTEQTVIDFRVAMKEHDKEHQVSCAKQEMEETIVAGSVKRLKSNFNQESDSQKSSSDREESTRQTVAITQKRAADVKHEVKQNQVETKVSSAESSTTKTSQKSETAVKSGQKMSTSRLLAEQRAYTIGLQTIPNIRGNVHSSYHYDLLLKTFFIHLTDVMVALSRFILAEPVLSQSAKAENISTEETITQDIVQQKVQQKVTKTQDEDLIREQAHLKNKKIVEEKPIVREYAKERMAAERFEVESQVTDKKKSGCKMAQLIEHKSEELTNKMDAVITEFQTKAGIEEAEATAQEVAQKESKEETKVSHSEESTIIETDMTQTEFKEMSSELTRSSNESVSEMKKESTSMNKRGKTTYRAIVESHVYTNKDAIFEEHFSETSSLQSGDATVAELTESILEEKRAETVAEETQQYIVTEAIESSAKINEAKIKGLQENEIEDSEKISFQTITESVIAKTVELDSKSSNVEAVEVKDENIKSSIEKLDETYISTAVTDTQESKIEDIKSEVSTVDKVQLSELNVVKSKEVLIVEATEPRADFDEHVTMKRPTSRKPSAVLSEDVEATVQKLKEVSPNKETVMTIQSNTEITSSMKTEFSTTSEVVERETKKEIEVSQTKLESKVSETKQTSEVQTKQETLTARNETRAESLSRLTLDLTPETPKKSTSQDSFPSTIDTPTPASVPPTPITDEYMFRIQTPLPKCTGPQPSPDTPSPVNEFEHEDFGIVKKKLNPYIETEIQRIVYDPPLPTPVEVKDAPEFGIAQKILSTPERNSEEEILEIERTSSLLASAIDETIKSIEEYKESVGMETRRESDGNEKREEGSRDDATMYSSYVKEPVTTIYAEVKPVINAVPEIAEKSNFDNDNIRRASQTETVLIGTNETVLQEISSRTRELQERFSSRTMTEQEVKESFSSQIMSEKEIKGYRPVMFDQEEIRQKSVEREEQKIAGYRSVQLDIQEAARVSVPRELTVEGETLGTKQGIMSGLTDCRAEQDSTELGKPGMSEQKIAELISGESEMLREAHVMGLKRVIASHMTRPDDSSVDFKKIKPVIDSLKDSAVLAALNEELTKTKEEKKQEERKWTTFMQKPERPTPKAKFGYHGWLPQFDPKQKPYKVEIKKQPKPKVAPDYKPERAGFETGPLPWEARAANEPPLQMDNAEDPILIPEEDPEFYEAVDPMPESEVPDLEETGIPLPPERSEEDTAPAAETVNPEELEPDAPETEVAAEVVQESEVITGDMEQNRLAEQLLNNVQGMVDPNATLEQQLTQMRLQLAALAQLPGVIQQTLELVSKQLMQLSQTETRVEKTETTVESVDQVEVIQRTETVQEAIEQTQVSQTQEINQTQETTQAQEQTQVKEQVQEVKQEISAEEIELKRRQDEEQRQSEKEKKEQEEQERLDHESRQVKHHPTPRAGKPKPAFGPLVPQERPIVLSGGRKWRKPKDAYNEQFFTETLAAQAEIIQGNTKGINFMKYEKPPISLEHLKDSDVYKMIHHMEQVPLKRTDLLTPVVAECDYREKCRSISPCVRGSAACDMP